MQIIYILYVKSSVLSKILCKTIKQAIKSPQKNRHTDEGRYPLYTNRVAPNLRWGDVVFIIPAPKSWRSDSEDG